MDSPGGAPGAPAPEPLQFDKAEFTEAPATRTCGGCSQTIAVEYFAAGSSVLCPACAGQISNGAGKLGALRAFGYGMGAALAGTLVWTLIIKITGMELGIVAIAVGLLVGFAVRKGARGLGGWKYQAMAMALTYFSITASYVPFVIDGLTQAAKSARSEAPATAGGDPLKLKLEEPMTGTGTAKGAPPPAPPSQDLAVTTAAAPAPVPGVVALLIAIVLVFGLALAGPFLAGASNIMGILIIGIALYEAWKLNKRVVLSGPFRLGSEPAAPAETAPPSAPP